MMVHCHRTTRLVSIRSLRQRQVYSPSTCVSYRECMLRILHVVSRASRPKQRPRRRMRVLRPWVAEGEEAYLTCMREEVSYSKTNSHSCRPRAPEGTCNHRARR